MKRQTITVYLALMVNFIFIILMMTPTPLQDLIHGPIFLLPFAVFLVLGLVLCILSFKEKKTGRTRKFLMITGGSAVGIFLSMILHNLVYGLFILLFGEDFWRRSGLGDEGVFFILAVIILPIVFIVGAIGSGILLVKQHRKSKS